MLAFSFLMMLAVYACISSADSVVAAESNIHFTKETEQIDAAKVTGHPETANAITGTGTAPKDKDVTNCEDEPTRRPTSRPPSQRPTAKPTRAPSWKPSAKPTSAPTVRPTLAPTFKPTLTPPTARPTMTPSAQPTAAPTTVPTARPTFVPTRTPTFSPTVAPSANPTAKPTTVPTNNPTAAPTANPSATPTTKPTASGTGAPSVAPSTAPTVKPTIRPTANPTSAPTFRPTAKPTMLPTLVPTSAPTVGPTMVETTVWNPTDGGSGSGSGEGAGDDDAGCFYVPVNFRWHYSVGGSAGYWSGATSIATNGHCITSTQAMEGNIYASNGATIHVGYHFSLPNNYYHDGINPSNYVVYVTEASVTFTNIACVHNEGCSQDSFTAHIPDQVHTCQDNSWYPSPDRTSSFVWQGTVTAPNLCAYGQFKLKNGGHFTAKAKTCPIVPSATPTVRPTKLPSAAPTAKPSAEATTAPTKVPTANPTAKPTSAAPTVTPSANPTAKPTQNPSAVPTLRPTVTPTLQPSGSPIASPTYVPTLAPTATPTFVPTAKPTANPTWNPTAKPTANPTTAPTFTPTQVPRSGPTAMPSSGKPSLAPTAGPTLTPTRSPSANPSANPTATPTVTPTRSPSASPSANPTATPTASPSAVATNPPSWVDIDSSSEEDDDDANCQYVPTYVRWHYSAGGSPGTWSGLGSVGQNGFCVHPQSAMEGDLWVSPGQTINYGYSFQLQQTPNYPNSRYTVYVSKAHITFNGLTCATQTETPAQSSFTAHIPSQTHLVTDYSWYPSSDQHNSLVFQGTVNAPFYCNVGQLKLTQGAVFSARVKTCPIVPTASPTAVPTFKPTANPTADPTQSPSAVPTLIPSAVPTADPSVIPSAVPSRIPTLNPTKKPSAQPTLRPTASPTEEPTTSPSLYPTVIATDQPTLSPSANPSQNPTNAPTADPTAVPTAAPTAVPTANPTANPTITPSAYPTLTPSKGPTASPSAVPTISPSARPTAKPSQNPTAKPTEAPTDRPSQRPTLDPTARPTEAPTADPTQRPTNDPSSAPTEAPTADPTTKPTNMPSTRPTVEPTDAPSVPPTEGPTDMRMDDDDDSSNNSCLEWVLGYSRESCSLTCSRVSMTCSGTHFKDILTQQAFYEMVADSYQLSKGGSPGTATQFCNMGINTFSFSHTPAAFTYILCKDDGTHEQTYCNYPTSNATLSGDCDTTYQYPPAQRFCPCVSDTCETCNQYVLGYSSESCTTTCSRVSGECNNEPLTKIVTQSEFYFLVSNTYDLCSNTHLTSATQLCTHGINLFQFAQSPAVFAYETDNLAGKAEEYYCNYPTSAVSYTATCDTKYIYPPAKRFCSCDMPADYCGASYSPSAIPSAAPTVVPTVSVTASPSTGKPFVAPTRGPTLTPTAGPTTALPSVSPSVKPSVAPTKNPTQKPTAMPTAAPTGCFKFVIGYSSKSCTDTCNDPELGGTAVCHNELIAQVDTMADFNVMLANAMLLGSPQNPPRNATHFCGGGVNNLYAFATAPAAFAYQRYIPDPSPHYVVDHYCYFPPALGGVFGGTCDTAFTAPPSQRMCACAIASCTDTGAFGYPNFNNRRLEEENSPSAAVATVEEQVPETPLVATVQTTSPLLETLQKLTGVTLSHEQTQMVSVMAILVVLSALALAYHSMFTANNDKQTALSSLQVPLGSPTSPKQFEYPSGTTTPELLRSNEVSPRGSTNSSTAAPFSPARPARARSSHRSDSEIEKGGGDSDALGSELDSTGSSFAFVNYSTNSSGLSSPLSPVVKMQWTKKQGGNTRLSGDVHSLRAEQGVAGGVESPPVKRTVRIDVVPDRGESDE